MEYRHLGRSGLKVSTFAFGAMTFGEAGKSANVGETVGVDAQRLVDLCVDAGVNLFDTADVYAEGQSEEVLGQAIGKRRADVLIATKFVGRTHPGPNGLGASRRHIIEACEQSLRRLGTDYIDLYQLHNQDLMTPAEETLRALDDLVRAGKVRYIGSSNHAGWVKMRALATSDRLGLERYVSQQIQYSLLVRDAEDELLPLGHWEGVGALVWSPLAAGYLSGKYRDDQRASAGRLQESGRIEGIDDERGRRIVDVVARISTERDVSLSQVALNWVVRKGGVSSVIAGARTEKHLRDNLAAAHWSLRDDEVELLDEASSLPRHYPYHMHQAFMPDRNPLPPLHPEMPPGLET